MRIGNGWTVVVYQSCVKYTYRPYSSKENGCISFKYILETLQIIQLRPYILRNLKPLVKILINANDNATDNTFYKTHAYNCILTEL